MLSPAWGPASRHRAGRLDLDPWREAWKYGERAFRYCQHDVGHAIGAVALAAAALGWESRLLESRIDRWGPKPER